MDVIILQNTGINIVNTFILIKGFYFKGMSLTHKYIKYTNIIY